MKNSSKFRSFFAGFLAAVLLLSCGGSVLAASGVISYNTAGLKIGADTVFAPGEELTTASGAKVPSVILYTDEHGGGTHYVPAREVAEGLGLPLTLKQLGDGAYIQFQQKSGVTYNGELRELPVPVTVNKAVQLDFQELRGQERYEKAISFDPAQGRLLSISVENRGTEPLEFSLGVALDADMESTSAIPVPVPAGETVTRTLEAVSQDGSITQYPYICVGGPDGASGSIRASVRVVQLEA